LKLGIGDKASGWLGSGKMDTIVNSIFIHFEEHLKKAFVHKNE